MYSLDSFSPFIIILGGIQLPAENLIIHIGKRNDITCNEI